MNCQIITYIYICFSRPVRFDNTAYLNRSGAETRSFNRIISFEIFQRSTKNKFAVDWSTAIDVLGIPALDHFNLLFNKVENNRIQFNYLSNDRNYRNSDLQNNFRARFSNNLSRGYRNKSNTHLNSKQNFNTQFNWYTYQNQDFILNTYFRHNFNSTQNYNQDFPQNHSNSLKYFVSYSKKENQRYSYDII
jgi:hypothetical protein